MYKRKLKANKGISMVDIAIAVVVLALFVGVIGNLYIKIATNNAKIKMNAIATYYVVQVAEYIHKIGYEKVENMDNSELKTKLSADLKEAYLDWSDDEININVTVTEPTYSNGNEGKEDILKQVEIVANYTMFGETETYKVVEMKVKESGFGST